VSLSADDFEKLLGRLGANREQAAEQYERLRARLIKYFAWEQCDTPEEMADEALDRLARKLELEAAIQDVRGYLGGIARILVKERQSAARRRRDVLAQFANWKETKDAREDIEDAAADLASCLERFTAEQRAMILRYYTGDHGARIENRKRMAAELGINENALRNRAMRLRELLEKCMTERGARDRSRLGAT
jgi:DNA-directed RNA polymerase specialized sigma24 family protein